MICEQCGTEHDGSYGSGRFCSRKCRCQYTGQQSNKNGKLTGHAPAIAHKASHEWVCPHCGKPLSSRRLLTEHKKTEHPDKTVRFIVVDGKRKLIGHAWNKGLTQTTDERVKQYVTTLNNRYSSGTLNGSFTGHIHTEETKAKIRASNLQYIKQTDGGPRYNIAACAYFDKLNAERGWNLQHAMNGGEVRIGRYALDAYDAERNIAVEYDEHRHHYTNGSIQEKDVERMRSIKEATGCTFYRYNAEDCTLVEM